ncbi:protein AIM2 [Chaetomidium leptoderma]|uniref:Protein AIM2 n=1 Tax=Chaetomidium leptoderma TaxID=669021 RepID=A0AAN6VLP7_9PEZI|nr:protein AIM2 [Chaetomidium leptoderma]
MRASFSLLSFALLLVGGAVAGCDGKPQDCQTPDASLVAHSGKPQGTEVKHDDITLYISQPDKENARAKARDGAAVLYLTDVFGIALPENKLLADSFARAGYLTVAPDLFNGAPAPGDINVPGFNTTDFLAKHTPAVTDPILASTIEYLRTELNVSRIAATGYCFGGRYSFRLLDGEGESEGEGKKGAAVDVGFAAHPSLLETSEIAAVKGPVAIAAADGDTLFNAQARAAAEAVLLETAKQRQQPYQVVLYSGTQHGFAVRADVSDPQQKYAKEEAFLQAVRWFDRFLVEDSE